MRGFVKFVVIILILAFVGWVGYQMGVEKKSFRESITRLWKGNDYMPEDSLFSRAQAAYDASQFENAANYYKQAIEADRAGNQGDALTESNRRHAYKYLGHSYYQLWDTGGRKSKSWNENALNAYKAFRQAYPDSYDSDVRQYTQVLEAWKISWKKPGKP